jgi:hypothetical protein
MFARSYDEAKELITNRGGTILPILAEKTKDGETVQKYSVAMYNGYSDTADQIAAAQGVTLSSSAGNGSKNFIDIIRLIFYGIIVYGLSRYVYARFFRRKKDDNV